MSAKSAPSATISDDSGIIGKRAVTVMLDQYLANAPTITEKLAFPQPPKKTAKAVGDNPREAEEFLSKWQASWEKRG